MERIVEIDLADALSALDCGVRETRQLRGQLRLAEWDAKAAREAYQTAKDACLANIGLIEDLNYQLAELKGRLRATKALSALCSVVCAVAAIAGWLR